MELSSIIGDQSLNAVFVATLAVFSVSQVLRRRRSLRAAAPVAGERSVELIETESLRAANYTPAVSAVTFFEGDSSAAEQHLRERVADIVALNPWLQGHLVRGRRKLVCLCFPEHPRETLSPTTFAVADHASLNSGVRTEELAPLVADFTVPANGACIDTGVPLFRVTLIRCPTQPSTFAVCVSMSHVIGDGHTFYALHDMLSASLPPRSLTVERSRTFLHDVNALLGGCGSAGTEDFLSWVLSAAGKLNFIGTALLGGKPRTLGQRVSPAWLDAGKRRAAAEIDSAAADSTSSAASPVAPAFVSSNDIVTSFLLRATGSDVCLMAVNMRGRVPNLTEDMAGNYEVPLLFFQEDVASPQLIRRALLGKQLRRPLTGARPMPGFLQSAVSTRVSIVSTWATFYRKDVEIPGAKLVRHAPALSVTGPFIFADAIIVYRPRAGKELELLGISRSLTAEALKELGGDPAAAVV